MALMDLPMELLVQILEEVGGNHLRRDNGVGRLALCRKWYTAARSVYLSGLEATDIHIYGFNVKDLDIKYGDSGLRSLMYKNTRRLRVRLLGHFWDERTAQVCNNQRVSSNTLVRNVAPFDFTTPDNQIILERWRDEELAPRLDELFGDLSRFSVLEDVTFEASSDSGGEHEDGPHYSYLYASTIVRLLTNLPILHDLSRLTLDLCGLEAALLSDGHPSAGHICHQISDIVPRIETVRIRTPQICPDVYRLAKLDAHEVRLKNLTIKLHLPNFSNSTGPWVKACPKLKDRSNRLHIYEHMGRGAGIFLDGLARLRDPENPVPHQAHGMSGFRISFVYRLMAPKVIVLDCLTKHMLCPAEEFLWFHDDGTPSWIEFVNEKDMRDNGVCR